MTSFVFNYIFAITKLELVIRKQKKNLVDNRSFVLVSVCRRVWRKPLNLWRLWWRQRQGLEPAATV